MNASTNCQCPCGETRFIARRPALMRIYCHCTICQSFNQAPFADISVFSAADVQMPDPDRVEFRTLRPPPAVQRGACVACGKPAIETLRIVALPKLVMIPSANIGNAAFKPSVSMHAFYDTRVADFDDDLPKYSGYWSSQLRFGRELLSAMLARRRA